MSSSHRSNCSFHSFSWIKYSISICSNSRVRKMKFPGVISFLNALPICAMPKGNPTRIESTTLLKSVNIACAVSGRRYAVDDSSSTGPTNVLNIRLNFRGWVSLPPHSGHDDAFFGGSFIIPISVLMLFAASKWSALKLRLHEVQSTRGSEKFSRCPDASQILGLMRIAASRPTMSSRPCTYLFHHERLMLFFSSTPRGPKSQLFAKPPYISDEGKINPLRLQSETIFSIESTINQSKYTDNLWKRQLKCLTKSSTA